MKWSERIHVESACGWKFAVSACCLIAFLCGCRSTVPIYVWQPAPLNCPREAKIAIAPIAGREDIAMRVESALLAERPSVRSDLQLISSKQLLQQSPIQLVSTFSLQNDATALESARQSSAQLLLEGEVLSAKLIAPEDRQPPKHKEPPQNEQLLISWRVVDVATSKSVANQVVSIDTRRADKDYPDMLYTHTDPTDRLIAASARDSWKAIAPSVERDKVELMVPWLQIGAMKTRHGIVAAHKGRWDLAEKNFAIAARRNPFNIAAHHNLAIAAAAREDFSGAKQQLADVSWPFSYRLPAESRFWLDQRHRQYQAAHGLGKPPEGWLFPDPAEPSLEPVKPAEIADMPWWTAIPFTKPPEWTWRAWFNQPWIL